MKNQVYTFTKRYEEVRRVVALPVRVKFADADDYYQTNGLIDTGAVVSMVSKKMIKKIGANPFDYHYMATASEAVTVTPVYKAAITLCDRLTVTNLTVSEGALPDGEECLIGMDILSLGDLAITHFEDKTCISFRIPSQESIELKEII